MAKLIAVFVLLTFGTSAHATISCTHKAGYEIVSSPGGHRPWIKLALKKNGVVIVENLDDNGEVITNDALTGEYLGVHRGVSFTGGLIQSMTLIIKLNKDGGYTGMGDAVVYDGKTSTEIRGFDCVL